MLLLTVLTLLFLFLMAIMYRQNRQMQQSLRDLKEAQEKIDTLMKVVPAGIFQGNAKGECLFVNQTWNTFTGLSSQDALGFGWKTGIHPDDLKHFNEEWDKGVEARSVIQINYRYRGRNGELHWIHFKAVPHFNEKKELVCYYGATVDFTRQKETEEALRENRNLLSVILDNLPVALELKDVKKDFSYVFANRKSLTMSGRAESDVVDKTDFDLWPRETAQKIRSEDASVCRSGVMLEVIDKRIDISETQSIHVNMRKIPIRNAKGEVSMLLGVLEDRTAQKHFERLIEEQRVKLIHSEKMSALGEMAGGIAHEINNPLAVIELNAGQLKTKIGRGVVEPVEVIKYADRISSTVQRIATIVRGLRTFARDGEKDPFEAASVAAIAKEAFEFCQVRFQQHKVRFEVGSGVEGLQVECRPVQLSQVFVNLLNNSFDAVHRQDDPWVKMEVLDLGSEVEIAVTDSGAGIPATLAQKIMQPFFTTKEVGKGTGLGLSISQGIVRGHGGSLSLDASSPHTRFVIRLPKQQKSISYKKIA